MSRLQFQLEAVAPGSRARAGRFRTLHNEVLTPLFMPVGTHATVRAQRGDTVLESGSQILLANTYHLLLRPGPELMRRFGGIHQFMRWPRSVLTDSGGFQIFAMATDRVMSEEGARFLSYVDGKHVLLTPEISIETQKAIGSDIMMVLDQCVPSTVEEAEARAAMELSNRWALRSLAARKDSPQAIFAIVQGACYPGLRKEAAEFLAQHPFDGFALGGLAVGESRQEREDTVEFAAQLLPPATPRYLMGVGTPIDLLEAVHRGMDMFDCIIPTAHAEQGLAYTWKGKVALRRGTYRDVMEPIDPACGCLACRDFSRAYLHHLIKTHEPLGRTLIGAHNIHFFHQLMRTMRERILDGSFAEFHRTHRERLAGSDEEFPVQRQAARPGRPMEMGDFIVEERDGVSRIRDRSSGEAMHPMSSPQEEAETVYVAQSRIAERIRTGKRLVLWDVGMGAATNVMAAIRAFDRLHAAGEAQARLEIYSFENRLDSLRLAMLHSDRFPHVRHGGPGSILARGEWISKKTAVEWRLLEGDFLELFERAPPPDIVFYDPFSTKANPEFWSVESLERLFRHWRGHTGTELFTYSSSTAVRASLLAAGLFVARGCPTGPKGDTTVACTEGAVARWKDALLGPDWLERWERSDARAPLSRGCHPPEELLRRVRSHTQFR